jgi:hypothetical protein
VAALLLAGDVMVRNELLATRALALLSGLLAVLAVLGAALPAAAGDIAIHWPLTGSAAALGLLLGAASASVPSDAAPQANHGPEQQAAALLVAGGLCMAVIATLSAPVMPSAANGWSGNPAILTIAPLFGGFAIGLAAVAALARLPRVPAGDLLVPIGQAVTALVAAWTGLGATLGRWSSRLGGAVGHLRGQLGQQRAFDRGEGWLRQWSSAMLLLLVVGAAVALLAQPG